MLRHRPEILRGKLTPVMFRCLKGTAPRQAGFSGAALTWSLVGDQRPWRRHHSGGLGLSKGTNP